MIKAADLSRDPPVTDEPVFWFCRLSAAAEEGDLETAARALRELRRLGVDVRYRFRQRPPVKQGVAQ